MKEVLALLLLALAFVIANYVDKNPQLKEKILNFGSSLKGEEDKKIVELQTENEKLKREISTLTDFANNLIKNQKTAQRDGFENAIIHINGRHTLCQISPIQIKAAGINSLNIDCPP